VSCTFVKTHWRTKRCNKFFALASNQILVLSSFSSVSVSFFVIYFCPALMPYNVILLQYCKLLIYTALYCQDTSCKTSYDISFIKNSVQRYYIWILSFSTVLFLNTISQNCELCLCVSEGQLTKLNISTSNKHQVMKQPTVCRHISSWPIWA
jgi:hypothetical protein